MICICGRDLGHVTLKTQGLCDCGLSKWMLLGERITPKSQAIADGLNRRRAGTCIHSQNPCISRCGVLLSKTWEPIRQERRQLWFRRVNIPAIVFGGRGQS